MNKEAYIKAYEKCLEELKSDFKEYPKSPNGSNYPYMTKIGQFYFSHSDFAHALVSGEHSFYAFSRGTALEFIKMRKRSRYEHYKHCLYLEFTPNHNDIFSNYRLSEGEV